jgi:hypothetical protein
VERGGKATSSLAIRKEDFKQKFKEALKKATIVTKLTAQKANADFMSFNSTTRPGTYA